MVMPLQKLSWPLVNGHHASFVNVELSLAGMMPAKFFTKINYGHKAGHGRVSGAHVQAYAMTQGEYTAEGSMTVLLRYAQAFRQKLGDGYLYKFWNALITVQGVDNGPMTRDQLIGCLLTGDENNHQKGPDGLTVDFPFMITRFVPDGVEAIPLSILRR